MSSSSRDRDDESYMKQHVCACAIDIAGAKLQIVHRDIHDPVPWTEIRVLQEVHGEEAVFDIRPVALVPRDTAPREKERLVLKYGRDPVEAVYAGKTFSMEWFVPGWPVDPTKAKRKPPNDRPTPVQIHKPPREDAGNAGAVDTAI
jgi:hypothetical protein